MKIQATVIMTFFLTATTAVMAQQSPDWKLNAPYRCPDGSSYTITKRTGSGGGQMCWWTQRRKGQFDANVVSRCFALIGRLRGCKVGLQRRVAAPGTTAAPMDIGALNDTRYSCPGGFIMSVYQCRQRGARRVCWTKLELNGNFVTGLPKPVSALTKVLKSCRRAPSLNPAYLDEFPSGLRVAQAMVIGNPLDNAQRAIGAYYQLGVIIRTLAAGRALTPGEEKLLGEYHRMQSQLAQAAARKFPSQRFDLASNPFHYERSDPRFGFQGIPVWTAFLTPALQSRFAQLVGGNDRRYVAEMAQQRQYATEKANTDAKLAASQLNESHNAGSVAVRHCMESGRSNMECIGQGVKTGFAELLGGHPTTGPASSGPSGLRVAGVYRAGPFVLTFQQTTVAVVCGHLVPQNYPYSVQRSGFQVQVSIPIRPRILALSYRANGDLVGPRSIEVAGRIVTGAAVDHPITMYQSTPTFTTHYLQPGAAQNYNSSALHYDSAGNAYVNAGATSTSTYQMHNYTVPTAPKVERCGVGALHPAGAAPSLSGLMTRVFGMHSRRSVNSAPGLRLGGTYASREGLSIAFRGNSATLVCGQAQHAEGYAVLAERGGLVVKFDNDTDPFSLVLQANGTLTGSGTVLVAGRQIYRTASGQMGYVPLRSHCVVGTLAARR